MDLEDGENLQLRIFVDRSIAEVFANDRLCIAASVYSCRDDSIGVSLRTRGLRRGIDVAGIEADGGFMRVSESPQPSRQKQESKGP